MDDNKKPDANGIPSHLQAFFGSLFTSQVWGKFRDAVVNLDTTDQLSPIAKAFLEADDPVAYIEDTVQAMREQCEVDYYSEMTYCEYQDGFFWGHNLPKDAKHDKDSWKMLPRIISLIERYVKTAGDEVDLALMALEDHIGKNSDYCPVLNDRKEFNQVFVNCFTDFYFQKHFGFPSSGFSYKGFADEMDNWRIKVPYDLKTVKVSNTARLLTNTFYKCLVQDDILEALHIYNTENSDFRLMVEAFCWLLDRTDIRSI